MEFDSKPRFPSETALPPSKTGAISRCLELEGGRAGRCAAPTTLLLLLLFVFCMKMGSGSLSSVFQMIFERGEGSKTVSVETEETERAAGPDRREV